MLILRKLVTCFEQKPTKCNPLAAILGGLGMSAGSNAISYGFDRALNRQNYDLNLKLMQEQDRMNRFNTEEQNRWNRDEWTRQFEMMNDYSYLRKQIEAAGLNAKLMFGNNASMSSAGSVPIGGAASTSLNSAGLASAGIGNTINIAEIIEQLSRAHKNEAEAGKAGAETKSIEETLSGITQSLAEEVKSQQLANDLQQMYVNWMKAGPDGSRNSDKLYSAQYGQIMATISKYTKEADSAQSMSDLNDVLKGLNEKLSKIKDFDVELANEMTKHVKEFVQNKLDQERADIYKSRAEGSAALQNASTNRAVGNSQIQLNESLSEINYWESKVRKQKATVAWRTMDVEISQQLENLRHQGLANKLLFQQWREAVKNNDWQTAEKVLNSIKSITQSIKYIKE